MEGHVRRNCQKIRCRRCNLGGHREEECYTNLNRSRYEITNGGMGGRYGHNTAHRGVYDGVRSSGRYEANCGNQGTRNEPRRTNNGYVAYMDETNDERIYEENRDHPKANAPIKEESVGAVY